MNLSSSIPCACRVGDWWFWASVKSVRRDEVRYNSDRLCGGHIIQPPEKLFITGYAKGYRLDNFPVDELRDDTPPGVIPVAFGDDVAFEVLT